jgi:hypothetical protein
MESIVEDKSYLYKYYYSPKRGSLNGLGLRLTILHPYIYISPG